MMEARSANGVDPAKCAPAVTVPMGADTRRIRAPKKVPSFRRLVYMGHVRENQGLEMGLEVFARLRRRFKDLVFEIVGEGDLRSSLERRARRLGIDRAVVWHGYQPDHRRLEEILCRGGIGLALYEPSDTTFTTWADPGKPKVYLACGLPVLITAVPAVAGEIGKARAGAVVPFERDAIVRVLSVWLKRPARIRAMRRSALALSKRYDWEHIFRKALDDTPLP